MTKKPEEPSWELVVDAILVHMHDVDEKPVGLEGRGSFSQHTINLNSLEHFDWNDDWIKARPVLLAWLEHEFKHWWEDNAYDYEEAWRGWLEGYKITVHGDAYIDSLTKRLMKLYRERITETHPCSNCGKQASEKYSWGHPDKLIKQGYLDPDIYPDGIPMDPDFDRDSLEWEWRIICDGCWEKEHGRHRRRQVLAGD